MLMLPPAQELTVACLALQIANSIMGRFFIASAANANMSILDLHLATRASPAVKLERKIFQKLGNLQDDFWYVLLRTGFTSDVGQMMLDTFIVLAAHIFYRMILHYQRWPWLLMVVVDDVSDADAKRKILTSLSECCEVCLCTDGLYCMGLYGPLCAYNASYMFTHTSCKLYVGWCDMDDKQFNDECLVWGINRLLEYDNVSTVYATCVDILKQLLRTAWTRTSRRTSKRCGR